MDDVEGLLGRYICSKELFALGHNGVSEGVEVVFEIKIHGNLYTQVFIGFIRRQERNVFAREVCELVLELTFEKGYLFGKGCSKAGRGLFVENSSDGAFVRVQRETTPAAVDEYFL